MEYGYDEIPSFNETTAKYNERFFDVGICEEYAVTSAAGMALGGLKPIICIYSTFLQRSVDQIITDVCMQNAPVIFMIDRAGFVGSDGRTHQGLFDLSYLSMIPNLSVLAPKDISELEVMLEYALSLNAPVAIRYPNGKSQFIDTLTPFSSENKWEVLKDGSEVMLLAVGPRLNDLCLQVASEYKGEVGVINARSIKPLDTNLLEKYSNRKIVTLEENVQRGGFGESVNAYLTQSGKNGVSQILAVTDQFVFHATVKSQLESNRFSKDKIKGVINTLIVKS